MSQRRIEGYLYINGRLYVKNIKYLRSLIMNVLKN